MTKSEAQVVGEVPNQEGRHRCIHQRGDIPAVHCRNSKGTKRRKRKRGVERKNGEGEGMTVCEDGDGVGDGGEKGAIVNVQGRAVCLYGGLAKRAHRTEREKEQDASRAKKRKHRGVAMGLWLSP